MSLIKFDFRFKRNKYEATRIESMIGYILEFIDASIAILSLTTIRTWFSFTWLIYISKKHCNERKKDMEMIK